MGSRNKLAQMPSVHKVGGALSRILRDDEFSFLDFSIAGGGYTQTISNMKARGLIVPLDSETPYFKARYRMTNEGKMWLDRAIKRMVD